jgi:hypothetical protein
MFYYFRLLFTFNTNTGAGIANTGAGITNTGAGIINTGAGIGVMVASNMKPAAQCAKAAKTAMTVLGQIARAFTYRE